jgi:hypothetical protein
LTLDFAEVVFACTALTVDLATLAVLDANISMVMLYVYYIYAVAFTIYQLSVVVVDTLQQPTYNNMPSRWVDFDMDDFTLGPWASASDPCLDGANPSSPQHCCPSHVEM